MKEEQVPLVAGIPKCEIYDGAVFVNNAPFSGRVSLVLKVAGTPWAQASVTLIHLVVCLTTGPKPPPKRALHVLRSRASSFQMRVSSTFLNTLRTGSFKLFKRPFPGLLTILTL